MAQHPVDMAHNSMTNIPLDGAHATRAHNQQIAFLVLNEVADVAARVAQGQLTCVLDLKGVHVRINCTESNHRTQGSCKLARSHFEYLTIGGLMSECLQQVAGGVHLLVTNLLHNVGGS
jgi:hypothetical protein